MEQATFAFQFTEHGKVPQRFVQNDDAKQRRVPIRQTDHSAAELHAME